MAAKGADFTLVGDPFGDCEERVGDYDGKTDCLDGNIGNDTVNHPGQWGVD